MRFTFDPDQLLFRDTVREFLEKECTPAHAREGSSRERWTRLADIGVVGMTAPESKGGLGLSEVDLVLVLEECGRAALPEPMIETTAAIALLTNDELVTGLASGTMIATLGLGPDPLITHAQTADIFLLEHEGEIHVVRSADVMVDPQRSLDAARPLARVAWKPTPQTLLQGAKPSELFERAAFGAAAQLVGVGARMIEMAAVYSIERHQFGKPIGSFQAVKHKLADAYLALEFARPVVYRAADSIARDADARSRDVSMAKAFAGDAATRAARAALQTLGAIGYTQEHDLHVWMKRAWSLASAWGTTDQHADRVADVVLGSR